jgi:hypothetical protein
MIKLKNWLAKRSGDHITVTGEKPDGGTCKLSVVTIQVLDGKVWANDENGDAHLLVVPALVAAT